ncbi:nuclear transport factor 2 family protein [Micrococcus sp. ACRRV]|uniref:nuclear transport factor 2 family protein n=1 Tax=Micrococcus sp. ACRRV TaxID=2918203 RepID=UPI001EF1D3F1|nr:nuclear transport factor 2 family protein [Micrococcus sp. ACRRV]MCG7422562.1 nuclear transport factor 2 family protein [Micrococcus sp. ACRRV]
MNHLRDLERAGWDALCRSEGADFYGNLMPDDGVMILVNGAVLDRDAVMASLNAAPAWDNYELTDERLIPAGPSAATLVYRAKAHRGEEPPFEAIMSSTYTNVDGSTQLTVYQQTTATH